MTTATRDHGMNRWQRALLPAVEGSAATGTHPHRSARDWVVDVIIFVMAAALGAASLHNHLHGVSPPLGAVDVVLGVIACCALWVRRRHPLVVGLFTVGVSAFSGGSGGAAVFGLFTVAVHCSPRWTARVAGLSVAASAIYAALHGTRNHYGWGSVEIGLVFTAVAVGYGLYVRVRRELVLSLRERAQRLEEEQDLRLREARTAERTRIAREMHDVLAHRISLLSVHAGALEYNPEASPEEIARAVAVIRMSARAAQEELREVIGVLRDARDDDDSDGPGENGGSLPRPQPTLVDVPELIAESERAGMKVTSTLDVDAAAIPQLLGRTAYRIIQEALTNARKHAPGQQVTVDISGRPGDELTLKVVNRPHVGHAEQSLPAHGTGTGLIGLAERVGLVGGRLAPAPHPDGGFTLRAILPWPATE
jgi:signal transduction histidine kinase